MIEQLGLIIIMGLIHYQSERVKPREWLKLSSSENSRLGNTKTNHRRSETGDVSYEQYGREARDFKIRA
jgi:hypothetical protein